MTNLWRLALRNVGRQRRRSLATGAAIAVAFTGVMILGGYFLRIERFLRTNAVYLQHLGHVTLYKPGGVDRVEARPRDYSFTKAEQDTIARVLARDASVELVARYLTGMGLAGNGCKTVPFVALGVEPQVEARIWAHRTVKAETPELVVPLKGRAFPDAAGIPGAVGLSSGLARLLAKDKTVFELGAPDTSYTVPACDDPKVREKLAQDSNIQLAALTWTGDMSASDAEVVSVFHTPLAATEDSTLIMTIDAAQRLFDTDHVTYEAVFLKDHRDARAAAERIERDLRAAGVPVTAYRYDDEATSAYYAGSMTLLATIVKFIGILLGSVVVLTIVNAVSLSVIERTREMGTLRALGFRRGALAGLFVRETALLAVMAVAVGTAVAYAIAAAINGANIRFQPPGVSAPMQLLVTPSLAEWGALSAVAIVVSALAAGLTARRRSRWKIIDLLTDATG